jgi:hypothetical protein
VIFASIPPGAFMYDTKGTHLKSRFLIAMFLFSSELMSWCCDELFKMPKWRRPVLALSHLHPSFSSMRP